MQCKKCGNFLLENDMFCSNCGEPVEKINDSQSNNILNQPVQDFFQQVNNKPINNSETYEEETTGNILAVISLLLFSIPFFLFKTLGLSYLIDSPVVSSLIGLFLIVGLIVLIFGRVRYSKNKLLKVLMWIIISLITFNLLLIILVVIACHSLCGHW